jgi:phage head maturation protease
MPNRPTAGQLEQRSEPISVDGRRIRGRIPFGQPSVDLGGYTEVIEPRALDGANLDNLVATVEHAGVPIGRHPTTLHVEARDDGLHWSVDPPASRADIVEAVERGDLRAGSWRMVVARDRWVGDVRHIDQISELRDVALVTSPAYPTASVEYRSANNRPEGQEGHVPENTPAAVEPQNAPTPPTPSPAPEARSAPETVPAAPSLTVESRSASDQPTGSLTERFRARGFPAETASLPFDDVMEDRSVTWTGTVNTMNQSRVAGVPLGADQRFAWPAFPRVGVDAAVTSVAVAAQSARSLASASSMTRAIDATTAKPETGTTVAINTLALQQVATLSSGIPNVYVAQPAINSIVEQDLRLAVNSALDALILAGLSGAGFQAPGSDALLVSIRKAVGVLQAAGYSPDTLLLDPVSAVNLDTLTATATGVYVFGPANFAPGQIFGLQRRISSGVPAPVVVDSRAFGTLYASPVTLARFEENAGKTNTSLVRMELNSAFAVQRPLAAVRIAAS